MIRKYALLLVTSLFTMAVVADFAGIATILLWVFGIDDELNKNVFFSHVLHNCMFLVALLVCLFYWNIFFKWQEASTKQFKRRRKDWVAPNKNPFDTEGYLIPVVPSPQMLAAYLESPASEAEIFVDPDPNIPRPYHTWYDAYIGSFDNIWAMERQIDSDPDVLETMRQQCALCWSHLTSEQQVSAEHAEANAWKRVGQ